jgi:hypothetical protein
MNIKQNKITKKSLLCMLIAASFSCIAAVHAETIICKNAHDTLSKPIFGWTYDETKGVMKTPFGNLEEVASIDAAYAKTDNGKNGTYINTNRNFYVLNNNVVQHMHGEIKSDDKIMEWFLSQVGRSDNYTYTYEGEDILILLCRKDNSVAIPTIAPVIVNVGEEGICFFSTSNSEMVGGLEKVAQTAEANDFKDIMAYYVDKPDKQKEALAKRKDLTNVCKKTSGGKADCEFRWTTVNRDEYVKLTTAFGTFYSAKKTPMFNASVVGSKFVVDFTDAASGKQYRVNVQTPTSGSTLGISSGGIEYKNLPTGTMSSTKMTCFSDKSVDALKKQLESARSIGLL